MAYQEFLDVYAKHKGIPVEELIDAGKSQAALRYALSNRTRGAACVDRVELLYSKPIQGASILDLGCAYGGTCIELAKAGASTVGVDVMPDFIEMATANAKDEAQCDFYLGDFTDKKILRTLAGRKFDVFIVNHVFEHISDTVSLLENLSALSTDDAVIIFDFPNGHSNQSVRAEGHTGQFAAALIDPDCWHKFGRERARIYYRKWKYYTSLFEQFGFGAIVRATPTPPKDRRGDLLKFIDEMEQKRKAVDENLRELTDEVVAKHIEEIKFDIDNASDADIDLKYFAYFWRGIAAKRPGLIRDSVRRQFLESQWGI